MAKKVRLTVLKRFGSKNRVSTILGRNEQSFLCEPKTEGNRKDYAPVSTCGKIGLGV